jgi:hypothetical protein
MGQEQLMVGLMALRSGLTIKALRGACAGSIIFSRKDSTRP